MTVQLEWIRNVFYVIIGGIYGVVILLILLNSTVYLLGYVYDSLLERSLLYLGHFIGQKNPKCKNNIFLKRLWKEMQPKSTYLRYETPLVTYCFSYVAILLIASILPCKKELSSIWGSMLYLILYFIGMLRKYRGDKEEYERVLNNNMKFLKLSFLPLTFVITVLGFYFTITGTNLQEIPIDYEVIINSVKYLLWDSDESNLVLLLIKMVTNGIVLLLLLYVVSLPIQVIAYFAIAVINYFKDYKKAYKDLFVKYKKIVECIINYFI